jgi:hypothetical protein
MVEKQVLVRPGVDKTEPPVRQSLDRTFSHLVQLPEKVSLRRCPNQRAQVALPRGWYCIRSITWWRWVAFEIRGTLL